MESPPREFLVLVPEDPALRRRRWRRRGIFAGIALVMLVLALTIKPAARQLRSWHARRLAAETIALIGSEQWNNAIQTFQQAERLGPNEVVVLKAKARLLGATRNFAPATALWAHVVATGKTLSLGERREYASSALESGDVESAKDQLAIVQATGSSIPDDWLLKARLVAKSGESGAVAPPALRVISSPKASERQRYDASLLLLAHSADASARQGAWDCVERIGNNKTAVALVALNFTAARHVAAVAETAGEIPPPGPEGVANRLDEHPLARVDDHLRDVDRRCGRALRKFG